MARTKSTPSVKPLKRTASIPGIPNVSIPRNKQAEQPAVPGSQPPSTNGASPKLRKPPDKPNSPPGSPASNWQLPWGMSNDHKTFINHGCILDSQGYPIYPNRNTTFVLKPGAEICNFGSVGFTQRINSSKNTNNQWRLVRVTCLGVILCDQENCDYTGSPPTGAGKIEELIEK
ncbi:hypothetical protein PTTG_09925 [Puccinia triticina 1-1 BBBD Race 1]|uniref:Uncharacterized protein n=1 Tax=Puccinia triticina (isolate 1-1 / race 1 (BBBD)) TaxID=630390 RepID=A0A0C4F9P3_PUCT1|nr:hypothetical protein PTTG_09925 [Puccinia triticina 1-1 BBBD Race 1]